MAINDSNISNAQKLLSGVQTDFTKFRKSSVVTNSVNFLNVFQDPTFLCFKIYFHGIGTAQGPKTTGDAIMNDVINFAKKQEWYTPNGPKPEVKVTNQTVVFSDVGLFGNENKPNSALYYLKSIGDDARVKMLKDFHELLSTINQLYPWYFQSMTGLEQAWQRDYTKVKFKKDLIITCLESIDLRITLLMDLYRKIVWDWKHRRRILPENLCYFNMTVKVYDFRDFTIFPKDLNNLRAGGIPIPEGLDNFASKSAKLNKAFLGSEKESDRTQINFDFSYCQFDPDGSNEIFSTINNGKPEEATQKIKISYENIEENNIFRTLAALGEDSKHYYVKDYLEKEVKFLNEEPLIKGPENITDVLASLGQGLAANVSQRASQLVTSRLQNMYIGNVYGFSSANILEKGKSIITNPVGALESIITKKETRDTTNQKENTYDNPQDIHRKKRYEIEKQAPTKNLGNAFE